jgi:hypothetical protein
LAQPASEVIRSNAVAERMEPVRRAAQVCPNPFKEKATIHFTTAERGPAQVRVVNLLREPVAQFFEGELDAGEHSFSWDAGRNTGLLLRSNSRGREGSAGYAFAHALMSYGLPFHKVYQLSIWEFVMRRVEKMDRCR